jgi:hypothetical protein
MDIRRGNHAEIWGFQPNNAGKRLGAPDAKKGNMKAIMYMANSKKGGMATARLSTLHHSAESHVGLAEAMVACFLVVAVISFTLVVLR